MPGRTTSSIYSCMVNMPLLLSNDRGRPGAISWQSLVNDSPCARFRGCSALSAQARCDMMPAISMPLSRQVRMSAVASSAPRRFMPVSTLIQARPLNAAEASSCAWPGSVMVGVKPSAWVSRASSSSKRPESKTISALSSSRMWRRRLPSSASVTAKLRQPSACSAGATRSRPWP